MKNLSVIFILLFSAAGLVGCAEDSFFNNDYRDNGYYSPTSNNAGKPGYGRDYHQRNNHKQRYYPSTATSSSTSSSGYYSPSKTNVPVNQSPANGGYYSSSH